VEFNGLGAPVGAADRARHAEQLHRTRPSQHQRHRQASGDFQKGSRRVRGHDQEGQYDLITIMEVADEAAANALALNVAKMGNIRGQTLRAFTAAEMAHVRRCGLLTSQKSGCSPGGRWSTLTAFGRTRRPSPRSFPPALFNSSDGQCKNNCRDAHGNVRRALRRLIKWRPRAKDRAIRPPQNIQTKLIAIPPQLMNRPRRRIRKAAPKNS
jgi:uncharacterized protein with GYD domain